MKKALSVLAIFVIGFVILTGQKIDNDSPRWKSPVSISIDPSIQYSNFLPIDITVTTRNFPLVLMSPNGVNAIAPSYRPYPTVATQSECESYVNPNVPGALIIGWNSFGPSFYGTGFGYTTNGGLNWTGSNTLPGLSTNSGDPSVVINSTGKVFMNAIGPASTTQTFTWTTNGGVNWSPYVTAGTSGYVADKNHCTIDDKSTSPYYNNIYLGWSDFITSSTSPAIKFTRSTDNGATWSTAFNVTGPLSSHSSQGVNLHTGPNGEVYFVCATQYGASPWNADYIAFGKSTNAGLNWSVNESKIDANGIRGTLKTTAIRIADFPWMAVDKTGGPYNANIYVVWNQKNLAPAGSDPDICFAKSTDGGSNFSTPIRINNDPMNNGRDQWMPNICVDGYGGINIIFYDSRNPTTNDSAEVYVARSIDGGNTFTNNLVSDHRFKPKPISGLATGYQGDYIGISAVGNKVYPFWADDYSGVYQVWTAPIDLGPSIAHTPLGNTEQTTLTRLVSATITPAGSGINPSLTKLYYSKDNPTIGTAVNMTNSGTTWSADITMSGAGLYRYYITTTDSIGRTATSPSGAPGNFYSFTASTDVIPPVITHTTLSDVPKTAWPPTVTATVTDNIGVDSVWVKWYKNIPGNGIKQFKLPNTGGSNYGAAFNSIQADVNVGDSIFYRVYARDISSGHNSDSTTQRQFKIIAQATACIGVGTTSTSYPFYTLYEDSRTQMLYNASEIIAGGGASGLISKIGFTLLTVGAPAMSNFSIKMQTIAGSTISSWTTTGWTNVYSSASYTPPGTGLRYIDLSTPYYWNGTGNLLVEVCFDNAAWTSNSTVAGTAQTGTVVHYHIDGSTGCTMTGTSTASTRPNLCMVINTATGVNPIGNTVPQSYSLSQNYPNPFNPVTKINFALPKQGFVTLKIYDILGREVRTLVNEVKSAGQFSVDFNASEFSSGVYFYKLETNGFSDIKRMMLIK